MPYNPVIDARIRKMISNWEHIDSKKMFGGVCHLLNGNMFCGVYKDFLILRLGENNAKTALEKPAVKPFDITGRPMKGWVMVAEQGFSSDKALKNWLNMTRDFVDTLPPK